jgi:hypothetical protein
VVATSVELRTQRAGSLHGIELAGHLAEMLIGERLYRDLRETEQVNEGVRQLMALVDRGVIDRNQLAQVMTATGWGTRRAVPIVQIRPLTDLPGSAFAGFFDGSLRRTYVEAGLARARDVLAAMTSA